MNFTDSGQSQKAEMIAQKGLIDYQETYIKTQEYILSDKEKMFSLQEALIEDQKKRLKSWRNNWRINNPS